MADFQSTQRSLRASKSRDSVSARAPILEATLLSNPFCTQQWRKIVSFLDANRNPRSIERI
jgi:hypothetical protein